MCIRDRINPLIVTTQGQLKCLDAKVSFDSNSLYRHPEVVALRDTTEEDEKEIEASKYDLASVSYTHLDVYKRQGAGRMVCMARPPSRQRAGGREVSPGWPCRRSGAMASKAILEEQRGRARR